MGPTAHISLPDVPVFSQDSFSVMGGQPYFSARNSQFVFAFVCWAELASSPLSSWRDFPRCSCERTLVSTACESNESVPHLSFSFPTPLLFCLFLSDPIWEVRGEGGNVSKQTIDKSNTLDTMSFPDKQASVGLGGNRGFSDKAFIFVVFFSPFLRCQTFSSEDNPPMFAPSCRCTRRKRWCLGFGANPMGNRH